MQGSPFASGAAGAEQEMFVPVASVCLTRHYTRICSLGMLLCSRPPAHKILMLRRALYYIRTEGATLASSLTEDWLDAEILLEPALRVRMWFSLCNDVARDPLEHI